MAFCTSAKFCCNKYMQLYYYCHVLTSIAIRPPIKLLNCSHTNTTHLPAVLVSESGICMWRNKEMKKWKFVLFEFPPLDVYLTPSNYQLSLHSVVPLFNTLNENYHSFHFVLLKSCCTILVNYKSNHTTTHILCLSRERRYACREEPRNAKFQVRNS